MIACFPIKTAVKNVLHKSLCAQGLISIRYQGLASHRPVYSNMSVLSQSFISVQIFHGRSFASGFSQQKFHHLNSSTVKRLICSRGTQKRSIKCSIGRSWSEGCASTGLIMGMFICSASSAPVHAEASDKEDEERLSHGKKVYTNYSITGIPGDGRCLFRSVAHGACLRSGKPAPSESLQREIADELRARVADEFIKRRQETEWFLEGDFDIYVSKIRKPHVWGGEPELLMASHVLQMPITVYMHDKDSGGLISIAEYGEEYGKENPVRVLYHGYGHYEALQIPGNLTGKCRL